MGRGERGGFTLLIRGIEELCRKNGIFFLNASFRALRATSVLRSSFIAGSAYYSVILLKILGAQAPRTP